jgi:hypothetical protein
MILRDAQDSQPNMIDTVERCDAAGHTVILSQVSVRRTSFPPFLQLHGVNKTTRCCFHYIPDRS